MKHVKTHNPCDDCEHSFSKNNQQSDICKRCEFKRLQVENEILQINAASAFQEGLNENKALFEKEILEQFVQKLKTRADELKLVRIDGKWAISQYDIDKVLKELVGEKCL